MPQVLVNQLRGAAKDIPGAHVVRWLGHIALFDFVVGDAPRRQMQQTGGLENQQDLLIRSSKT